MNFIEVVLGYWSYDKLLLIISELKLRPDVIRAAGESKLRLSGVLIAAK
jgi:hypothetical protein